MRYDLNFWEPPDWKRESSIDPRFLVAVGMSLVLLALLAAWSLSHASLLAKKGELMRLTLANAKIRNAAQEVTRKSECLGRWQFVDAQVRHKPLVRMPWSRMLAAITEVIPDTVTIQDMTVKSQALRVEVGEAPAPRGATTAAASTPARAGGRRPKAELHLQYELTLGGTARGENADDVVSRFSRELKLHPGIAPWLDQAELRSLQPESPRPGEAPAKHFTIVCSYKSLDWYNESASPKISE